MAQQNFFELYSQHIFDSIEDLEKSNLTEEQRTRCLRLREMYSWYIDHPGTRDKDCFLEFKGRWRDRHPIKDRKIYDDISLVKLLVPNLTPVTKDWARWKFNEMIQETYEMAKKRKDTKTMERCASSYAKYNRIDDTDVPLLTYEDIQVQPFTATSDPSVLGIKPIPNIRQVVAKLIDKYSRDVTDIMDVDYEEVDTEKDKYFKPYYELNEQADILQRSAAADPADRS